MTTTPHAPGPLPPAAVWPPAAELAAKLESVLDAWLSRQSALAGWDATAAALSPAGTDWRAAASRLQLINAFQWREEDRSREPGAGDATLAAVKRSIDASNGRRVRAVEELDTVIVGALEAAGLLNAGAPPPSESPGSIVDRLTVLALKRRHARDVERLAILTEQWDDLLGCLDRMGADVAARKLRVKLYRQVKMYGAGTEAR